MIFVIGEGVRYETLVVFDEVYDAFHGALLVDGEGLVVDANKRVPMGARLILYNMQLYHALV